MLKRIRMFWCSTVPGGQQGESSMHTVWQTKTLVHRTLVLFEELHSVGCWLRGGPDEMPSQTLMSVNWTDKLCVQDVPERTVCYSMRYRQPVKLLKRRSYVITQTNPRN